jgi:hypothetical protein
VTWFLHLSQAEDCEGDAVVGASTATLSGDMAADQLVLTVDFAEANVALSAECRSDGRVLAGEPAPVTPDPLELAITVTGGVGTPEQALNGPTLEPGHASVLVLPDGP